MMKKMIRNFALMTAFTSMAAMAATTAIDTKESVISWKGTKVTGEHVGKLYYKEGKIETKDGKLIGGEFVVDMNSLTNEDLSGEWKQKFLDHMKSSDFFTVEKFPTSKLVIKSVNGNKAQADLTIKGKTNPVEFTFKEDKGIYTGAMEFNRTKFDMIYGSGSFFEGLGDKLIHDKVTLTFKLVSKK